MRIVDDIKGGLVIILDWQRKAQIGYKGFDGEEIWPDAKWQLEESTTIKNVSKILPIPSSQQLFNPITLTNGLASIDILQDVLEYKKSLQQKTRILYLQFSDFTDTSSNVIKEKFSFLGYDYGNYNSEDNYYSLICHEITGGPREEFKNYTKYLNRNLLFSSLDHIPALEKTKIELRTKGEHLEEEIEGEEFQPIAVYAYNE